MNQIAFEGQRRSSVETAALVSDLWTLRILRECFLNVRRVLRELQLERPRATLDDAVRRLAPLPA